MNNILNNKKGFTVVELLVVIVVIAILATISVASYGYLKTDARNKSLLSDISNIKQAMEIYRSREGEFPTCSNGTSECRYTENPNDTSGHANGHIRDQLESVTGIKNLPEYGFRYVSSNREENWGMLHFGDSRGNIDKYKGAQACKFGVNMNSGWWGSTYKECEDVL